MNNKVDFTQNQTIKYKEYNMKKLTNTLLMIAPFTVFIPNIYLMLTVMGAILLPVMLIELSTIYKNKNTKKMIN